VGHTAVVDYHTAPGGSYGVEGGLGRRRGPVARRFHEASWQPMLGDGDTHKVDRGASVSIGAKRGYYALRGVVSERRLAFLMKRCSGTGIRPQQWHMGARGAWR
jgi:hypothetical protein